MVKITVPATTANLGSGFDSLGLALSLYNEIQIEYSDNFEIISLDKTPVPLDEHNLIYRTLQEVHNVCGQNMMNVRIIQKSPIPMSRGLGSSVACVVSGVLGANALMGGALSLQDIIDISASLEGFADNSTAAILGGLVSTAMEKDCVCYNKIEVSEKLACCSIYTNAYLETAAARSVLKNEVNLSDAVYNLSRSALLVSSIATGNYENLRVACMDKLHQKYRLPFIESSERIMRECRDLNAYAVFVSGAGPSIFALYDAEDTEFVENLDKALLKYKISATILSLKVDNVGAVVETT